jgi:hypothetical protein
MTTYSYTLVLNDSEVIMLEAALKLMLKHCEWELSGGPKAPFWAWQHSAQNVMSRLHQNAQLTSYSVFSLGTPK